MPRTFLTSDESLAHIEDKRIDSLFLRTIFRVDVFVLISIVGILLLLSLFAVNQARSARLTCVAFTSYPQAYVAYLSGNKQLDGDKDGHPCNDLYKKYERTS